MASACHWQQLVWSAWPWATANSHELPTPSHFSATGAWLGKLMPGLTVVGLECRAKLLPLSPHPTPTATQQALLPFSFHHQLGDVQSLLFVLFCFSRPAESTAHMTGTGSWGAQAKEGHVCGEGICPAPPYQPWENSYRPSALPTQQSSPTPHSAGPLAHACAPHPDRKTGPLPSNLPSTPGDFSPALSFAYKLEHLKRKLRSLSSPPQVPTFCPLQLKGPGAQVW